MLKRHTGAQKLWMSIAEPAGRSRTYIALLLVVLAGTYAFLQFASSSPTRSAKWIIVRIPPGAGDQEVARILKSNNLIRSRAFFQIARHVGHEGRPYVAGTYRLRNNMSAFDVLDTLIRGNVATTRVTIPEGFTVRQIAARLADRDVINKSQFQTSAAKLARDIDVPPTAGSVEGYLFPDTYEFGLQAEPDDVLGKMYETMKSVLSPLEPDIRRRGRSVHEILTIASMIEREARTGEDRPLVASVIYNRLEAGMPLQVDATVLYAMGEHRSRVLYSHLENDSPYNTYRNKGLPPGPIANPGRASIEAAVKPARTDYLYYVATASGSHLFARTFEEHKANIRKARNL